MARFKNEKRKPFVRQIAKKMPTIDHVTGDKIPKSWVCAKGKLPRLVKQLKMDLRKLMLPFTASKLKEKKSNKIKVFKNVASIMGLTHLLLLSKTSSAPYMRVVRFPQGPTLTFKIHKYSLAAEIAQSQARPRCPPDIFKTPALSMLRGFGTGEGHLKLGTGEEHLKLTSTMFQNIFPAIDINTVKLASLKRFVLLNYNKETKLIDFRHYSMRLQPMGVSRRIRKFVQNHQVPDLKNLQDVSDFVTKAGYGSESEADDEAATVNLSSDIGRVKIQEIGPKMTLQLVKVEGGVCSGEVIFDEYGSTGTKKRGNEEDEQESEEDEEEQEIEDEEESITPFADQTDGHL